MYFKPWTDLKKTIHIFIIASYNSKKKKTIIIIINKLHPCHEEREWKEWKQRKQKKKKKEHNTIPEEQLSKSADRYLFLQKKKD